MAQCHLEIGNCTKKVDKGRGRHCYLIPVSTKHIAHDQPQTDCATCMVHMWCSYNKCESGQVEVRTRMEVAVSHHHGHEWCGWREVSLNQAELHSSSHMVGFATLAMNMLAVCECAAYGCQNNCLTSLCPIEYPFHTVTFLVHWKGGRKDSKPRLVFSILWHSKAEVQKWIWDQNICCCWEIGNLTVCYGRCLNYSMWRGTELMSIYYRKLCLSPLTYVYVKK